MKAIKDSEQVRLMLESQERVMHRAGEIARKMQAEALRKYERRKAAAASAAPLATSAPDALTHH